MLITLLVGITQHKTDYFQFLNILQLHIRVLGKVLLPYYDR